MSRPHDDHEEDHRRKRERDQPMTSPPVVPEAEDRLGKLPDRVLVHILSHLPSTKDRFATSSLSRRWRHLWTLVPSLEFSPSSSSSSRDPATYLRILGNLLHLYHTRAPKGQHLRRFYAHIFGNPDPRQFGGMVSRWMQITALRSISELSLSFEEGYDVPTTLSLRCILPCGRTLRVLRLQDCTLRQFPRRLRREERFPFLETLVLRRVDIADDNLGALVAMCPELESLEISECRCLRSIDLCCPRLMDLIIEHRSFGDQGWLSLAVALPELRYFHFSGVLQMVQWKVLPQLLSEARLELTGRCGTSSSSIWPRFHEAFRVVEYLSASSAFFQSRSIISKNLKELHCIKLECHKSFRPFLSYLNECPCLEELCITLYHGDHGDSPLAPLEVDYLGADYNMNLTSDASCSKWSWNFATKKIVIMGFADKKPDVSLAKFLLLKTQLLERLTLVYDLKCSSCEHRIKRAALKEFRGCKVASSNVKLAIRIL